MDENFGNKKDYNDKLIDSGLTGVVIKYISERGFGFIRLYNSKITADIFVYHNQIKNLDRTKEYIKLQVGQDVAFDLYSTERGYVAKNVNVMGMNQDAAVKIFKDGV
jgi:cold shock CspA family protein